jgi:hypothetical protein
MGATGQQFLDLFVTGMVCLSLESLGAATACSGIAILLLRFG